MNTRFFKLPVFILFAGASASGLWAQNAVNQFANDWSAIHWEPVDTAPTATQTSFFNGENYVSITNSTVAQVGTLRLGDTSGVSSSLTLEGAASLTVANGVYVGNAKDSSFTLNLDAGTFSAQSLFIGGVAKDSTAGRAIVNLGAAQATVASFIQFTLGTQSRSVQLNVTGEGGSLSAKQVQFAAAEGGSNPAEMHFTMGANGIGSIHLSGSLYGAEHIAVTVDGTDFKGQAGRYTLIETDSGNTGSGQIYGDFQALQAVNFNGYQASLTKEYGDLVLTLN